MTTNGAVVRLSIDIPLDRTAAFAILSDELPRALASRGLDAELRDGGMVKEGSTTVGRIATWRPAERVTLEWHPMPWHPEVVTGIDLRFEDTDDGTRVAIVHRGLGTTLGNPAELLGWFASELAARYLSVAAPAAMGDWLTDRGARRPTGAGARATYGAPLYHYPIFRVLLRELRLTPDDYLLEVGCGGGVLLGEALESGCRAAGIDHSPEMVRLARAQNADAVASGRLQIQQGSADALPFPDDTFSCATMIGVFGFLPDPVAALREIRRVLRPGGRLVMHGSDPEMRGTPAAPEPMASRLRFYESEETEAIARQAGFRDADVTLVNLLPYAREVGIPEEHQPLYDGGSRFLVARKEPS